MSEAEGRKLHWFFVSMASVLLVIVAVGFTPTFYVPGAFGPPELAKRNVGAPAYIIVHGIVMTLWFLLLFTQALLIAKGREPIHRKLGVSGAVIAAILVPLNAFVIARSVSRSHLEPLPVLGDFATLGLFAVLVILAIRLRHKPDVHKRLMLIGTISLTGPAIARWPGAELAIPFSIIVPHLLLLSAIVVFDIVTRRRVHRATGWGIAAYVVTLGIVVPLAMSDFGKQLVDTLK